jgi:hypothetical protein
VDTHRVSMLLMGMINSLTARHMFEQVTRPLSEDTDMAVNILFEGIAAQS